MQSDLVSCVMVTRANAERLPFIERAVAAYIRQTYPHRELVVALDRAGDARDHDQLEARLASLGRDDIRVVRGPDAPGNLGRLRNCAIDHARGALVCVWDDDDIHHPTRIQSQVEALRGTGAIATFLTDVLHLLVERRQLHWTTYKKAAARCVPGAGVFLRSVNARYPEDGPEAMRGEDTTLCQRLSEHGLVHLVDDSPHLYIYVCHGTNISGDEFHSMIARTLAVSRGRIERNQQLVRRALDLADTGLDEIDVMGNNGPAFRWSRVSSQLPPAVETP
jgi:glycosyltransferase involved in cell wall biosynthesis